MKKVRLAIEKTLKYFSDLVINTTIMWLIMPPIVFLTWFIMDRMGVRWNYEFPPFNWSAPLWLDALRYFYVGSVEEAVFRYMIQDRLFGFVCRLPEWASLILASIIFGSVHLLNPAGMPNTIPQAVGACFAGLWLGRIYRKQGLHMAILTHALYDLTVTRIL